MRKMLRKLFKRCLRNDTVSKVSSTNTQVIPLPSTLRDHLAATKIQSAFRLYKERYNTKMRDSCGIINAGSMPGACDKPNTPVERKTAPIKSTTSVSSTSSENLKPSSDIHSAHQGDTQCRHAQILRNFTIIEGLIKVHATMLRCLRAIIRINPSQNDNRAQHLNMSNNEDQKRDTVLKVDNWKLHLEPKSRNRTLQSRLRDVSILDCYGLCSSTSHFTSSESSSEDPDLVPVYLNVYDLTPFNACLYWLGLGVHHSGVQVYGVEYAFGMDESGIPRIFKMEPKNCEEFKFRKGILVGWSRLGAKEVKNVIYDLSDEFRRKDYHLITNNCNHFSTETCLRLTANSIPPWVNRLARIGSLFVRSGSWSQHKMKVLSRLKSSRWKKSSPSSSDSSVISGIAFSGKSSRWKKSVTPTKLN